MKCYNGTPFSSTGYWEIWTVWVKTWRHKCNTKKELMFLCALILGFQLGSFEKTWSESSVASHFWKMRMSLANHFSPACPAPFIPILTASNFCKWWQIAALTFEPPRYIWTILLCNHIELKKKNSKQKNLATSERNKTGKIVYAVSCIPHNNDNLKYLNARSSRFLN